MQVPAQYLSWLSQLAFHEVRFGCGGIELFPAEEIDAAQIGYSRSVKGSSFCDGTPGSWRPEWIAIGRETALGDPAILDTSDPTLRVITAAHGESSWEPVVIADTLVGFGDALRELKRASVGREHPAALDRNPLPEDERRTILERIGKAIGAGAELGFWQNLLEG